MEIYIYIVDNTKDMKRWTR